MGAPAGLPYHRSMQPVVAEGQLLVLDEAGHPTGELMPAAEVHDEGLWHAAIHVWLVRDRDHVLLSRAAPEAWPEPLKLGPSAVLHAAMGDEAEQAGLAVERLLGATLRTSDLRAVGTFKFERAYDRHYTDREHVQVFAAKDVRPMDQYVLHAATIDNVYEVPLQRAVSLFENGDYVPAPGFDSMRRINNALLVEDDLPSQGRDVLLAELGELAALLRAD